MLNQTVHSYGLCNSLTEPIKLTLKELYDFLYQLINVALSALVWMKNKLFSDWMKPPSCELREACCFSGSFVSVTCCSVSV